MTDVYKIELPSIQFTDNMMVMATILALFELNGSWKTNQLMATEQTMATDFIFSKLKTETFNDWLEFEIFYWRAMRPMRIKSK